MAPWQRAAKTEQSALVPLGGAATARSLSPSATAAASPAAQAAPTKLPDGFGQPTTTKRKHASVVEMLEYVKTLDIDPIKEADMLWIAEEAFNAALPPGWTEHQDDHGVPYFHNQATGESVWRHPMDDLFKEIVEFQRNVVRNGGFHLVEDGLAELEENIRCDLADWMELYDDHGEKFFYNRRSDESRFDDPRMAVYHNLYAKIRMVAKMKEKLPVLARAPRPEEPTMQELELRRRQQEAEEKYLKCLVKIQAFGRAILAKRHYRNLQAQATVQKGPQPLRGKFRLRMDRMAGNGKKELVLAMTTPHRRNRAAKRIQARVRGVLARKRLRPLIQHRAFLSKIVTRVQARARVWLAKRAAIRRRHQRVEDAATNIQRVYRGYRDRLYVCTLRGQKARYTHYMESVRFIQKRTRIMLERKKLKARHLVRLTRLVNKVKARARVQFARDTMEMIQLYANDEAATKIQAVVRGRRGRAKVKYLRSVAATCIDDVLGSVWQRVDARTRAAARMQGSLRMQETQKQGILAKKRMEFMHRISAELVTSQVYFKKYAAQLHLMQDMADERGDAAVCLQAAWRGTMVRNRLAGRCKEAPVVIKGVFEYTANSASGCSVEVKFAPSPGFDGYKYIVENGRPAVVALGSSIQELHGQLKSSMRQIHDLLDGVPADPLDPESGPADPQVAAALARAAEEAAAAAAAEAAAAEAAAAAAAEAQAAPKASQPPSRVPSKITSSRPPSKALSARPTEGLSARPTEAPAPVAEAAPAAAEAPGAPAIQEIGVQTTARVAAASARQTLAMPQQAQAQPPPQAQSPVQSPAQSKPQTPAQPQAQPQTEAQQQQPPPPIPEMAEEPPAESFLAKSSPPKRKKKASPPPRKPIEITSQAHGFLMEASKTWSDKAPAPHPDDPPRPPAGGRPSPAPPQPDPGAAKVQGLRTSQSEGALSKTQPAPTVRKSYGGTLVGGKFVRTNAETLDELSEQDQQQILADLERQKEEQRALLKEKAKKHKLRKQQEEMSRTERFKAQRGQVEQDEEERRRKKGKEMQKWLKAKEDEAKAKKARESELMQSILEKQKEKAEAVKKLDAQRMEERERRLKIAEKQKAKLEFQMMMQRQEREAGGGRSRAEPPAAEKRGPLQRVVHRHVHHHLHYHDSDQEGGDSGGEYQYGSDEERRRMEMATEGEVDGREDDAEQGSVYSGMLPQIGHNCETPTRARSFSTGQLLSYDDAMKMSRTQLAFKRAPQPKLQHYQMGLQKAMGSYADSGRPRRLL